MENATRSLLSSFAVAIASLVAIDAAYGRYAQAHFGPNATLHRAEAAGDNCIVTLGDSRMAAGIDATTLAATLEEKGIHACVAPLAVGALPISGQAMALRRYVADGKTPSVVVLGVSAGTLLEQDPPEADAFAGNRAAELAWSVPSDVRMYYSDFPFGDFDRGVRFSLGRSSSLSIYASALWFKAQVLQDRLARARQDEPRNRFGSLADMRSLRDAFAKEAARALSRGRGAWRLTRWFEVVDALVTQSHGRLVVVEVPMPASYRNDVLASTAAVEYASWLRSELAARRDFSIDLSAPPSVREEDFADGIHLDETGARNFSRDLATGVAPLLGASP